MTERSPEDRAWGFTRDEYVAAFSRIESSEEVEREVDEIFAALNADVDVNVGGEDHLFALLSLVSQSALLRVQKITGWSSEELQNQQQAALRLSRKFGEKNRD